MKQVMTIMKENTCNGGGGGARANYLVKDRQLYLGEKRHLSFLSPLSLSFFISLQNHLRFRKINKLVRS